MTHLDWMLFYVNLTFSEGERERGRGVMKRSPAMYVLTITFLWYLALSKAIESPQYSVVHSESDMEVRLYRESSWMSAPVPDLSFEKATRNGFHRLFQYIQGANLNFSRIAMTTPILSSIVRDAGPLYSSAYFIQLYLPVKFQTAPPVPLPELNLKPFTSGSWCVAVRKFSGFAKDENVVKEAEKLASSLSKSPFANSTASQSPYAYSIAQYNSPFKIIGRVNEVWVEVNACDSTGLATY